MFVSNIKKLRTIKGMTQKQVALKAHLSQMQISNIERNKKSTTLDTLEDIAKALECCVYETYFYQCNDFEKCDKPQKNFLHCMNCENYLKEREQK